MNLIRTILTTFVSGTLASSMRTINIQTEGKRGVYMTGRHVQRDIQSLTKFFLLRTNLFIIFLCTAPCADICDTDKTDKEFLNLVPSMLYRFGIFVKPDESLEIDTDGEGLTVTSSKVSVASKVQCYTPPPKITGNYQ